MERTLYKHIIDGLEMDQVIRDHEYSMVSRHLHETYELYYLTEGQRYYFIERQTYLVKSGDVVLIKPNLIHKTSIAGESYHNRILLQIDRAFMDGVLKACGLENMETVYGQDAEILHIPEDKQPVILELFASMEREMAQKQKGWLTAVKLQLARLLLEITRCPQITEQPMQNGTWNRTGTGHGKDWIEGRTLTQEEQKKDSGASARLEKGRASTIWKHQKVNQVADYLGRHPETSESLEELAKRFYISKSYLSRIFREVTSFTVNEYKNVSRIKKSQQLLLHSDCSITEVSDLLGFENLTYYERVFKKYTGVTPLKYRKENGYSRSF